MLVGVGVGVGSGPRGRQRGAYRSGEGLGSPAAAHRVVSELDSFGSGEASSMTSDGDSALGGAMLYGVAAVAFMARTASFARRWPRARLGNSRSLPKH